MLVCTYIVHVYILSFRHMTFSVKTLPDWSFHLALIPAAPLHPGPACRSH